MGFKPKARQTTNFEKVTFPTGPTTFTLEKIRARHMESTYNGQAKAAIKLMAVWKDGEGDELVEFLGCPKEFAYNEKSAFWNRITALSGLSRDLSEDDLDDYEISVDGVDEDSEDAWEDFNALIYKSEGKPYLDEKGKAIFVDVASITYKGRELIGAQCVLNCKPRFDKDGNQQEGNSIAADGALPLNAVGGGKKKSGGATPPPVAAPAETAAAMP